MGGPISLKSRILSILALSEPTLQPPFTLNYRIFSITFFMWRECYAPTRLRLGYSMPSHIIQ